MALRSAAALCAAAALAACASAPNTPRAALAAYARALESGDTAAAYRLLSDAAREDLSEAQFEALYRDNTEDLLSLARALRAQEAPAKIQAQVDTADGDRLDLSFEDGAWKLDSASLELYRQDTPLGALRSFVRAYQRERYDVLLRLAPEEVRAELDEEQLRAAWEGEQREELMQRVLGLRLGLERAEVEVLGDRATVRYGSGARVGLRLEGERWTIEDF